MNKAYYATPFAPKSNCTKEEIMDLLNITNKPILRTCGFKYKNPTTLNVKSTYEECIEAIKWSCCWEVIEHDDHIDLNYYSGSDMW